MGILRVYLIKLCWGLNTKKGNNGLSTQEARHRKHSCVLLFYLLICSLFYSHKLLVLRAYGLMISWRSVYQPASPSECRQGTHCDMRLPEHANTNSYRMFSPSKTQTTQAPPSEEWMTAWHLWNPKFCYLAWKHRTLGKSSFCWKT